jgi:hypothetical protein
MASLSTLVKKYNNYTLNEDNLERGYVNLITMGSETANFRENLHWRFFCSNTKLIEVWGGAGSVGKNCCCSIAMPANPPAYAKKTLCVDPNTWMCVCLGKSCGNVDTMCFRGCSEPTKVYICSERGNFSGAGQAAYCVCICAEGGMGGPHHCQSPSQAWSAQYVTEGYCFTDNGGSGGCGMMCNYGGTHLHLPEAYGGDFNCPGGISCMCANCCNAGPDGLAGFTGFVKTAAGIYGPEPRIICYQHQCHTIFPGHYDGYNSWTTNLMKNRTHPVSGMHFQYPCGSAQWCGCHETVGCRNDVSHGIPGWGSVSCGGVRAYGGRGGHGAVRITILKDENAMRTCFNDTPTECFVYNMGGTDLS